MNTDLIAQGSVTGTLAVGGIVMNPYVLSMSEIEGGRRLVIQRGEEVQTLDILHGEPGPQGDQGVPGRDGVDAPGIEDEAVSAEHPWSSRQIVNALCPALHAAGNPVVCAPVPGSPLAVKVMAAASQQSIMVKQYGKNLCPNTAQTQMKNGLTIQVGDDKSIHVSGTATDKTYIPVTGSMTLPAGTYTLSGCPSGGGWTTFRIYDDMRSLQDMGGGSTATLSANTTVMIYIFVEVGMTMDHIFRPQIEVGGSATAYEPYSADTYTITLPDGFAGGEVDVTITALPGVNTLMTDAQSLTVTGRADPVHIIGELTDRLSALERAMATE